LGTFWSFLFADFSGYWTTKDKHFPTWTSLGQPSNQESSKPSRKPNKSSLYLAQNFL